VHVVRRDHRQSVDPREIGERIVAARVLRIPVIEQLDGHAVVPEQIDEAPQRRLGVPAREPLTDPALAAAGEDRPLPVRARREVVEIVDRAALLAAAQLRTGDDAGESVVPLYAAGEYEQMLPGRIGDAALRRGESQREFGAVHGLQTDLRRPLFRLPAHHDVGRLGEPRRAVEAVVIGDRERGESEPHRLGQQVLRRGGAVEEGVRGVRVQLGVRRGVRGRRDRRRRCGPAPSADRPRIGSDHRRLGGGWRGGWRGGALAAERLLELLP
jgi:hypothetical protein